MPQFYLCTNEIFDFAFLPILAVTVTSPILAAKQYRNLIFILLLLLLRASSGLIHAEVLGIADNIARLGLKMATATIILNLVITVRIFPFLPNAA